MQFDSTSGAPPDPDPISSIAHNVAQAVILWLRGKGVQPQNWLQPLNMVEIRISDAQSARDPNSRGDALQKASIACLLAWVEASQQGGIQITEAIVDDFMTVAAAYAHESSSSRSVELFTELGLRVGFAKTALLGSPPEKEPFQRLTGLLIRAESEQ
jgi:hypothetical protein